MRTLPVVGNCALSVQYFLRLIQRRYSVFFLFFLFASKLDAFLFSRYKPRLLCPVSRAIMSTRSTILRNGIIGSEIFSKAASLESRGFVKHAIDAFEDIAMAHNSSHSKNDPLCAAEVAYLQLRLAHLAHDGLGDLSRAEKHLISALLLDVAGPSAAVLDQLGMVLQTAGDLRGAINSFERAIDIVRVCMTENVLSKSKGMVPLVEPHFVAPFFHLAVARDIERIRGVKSGIRSMMKLESTSSFHHWGLQNVDDKGDGVSADDLLIVGHISLPIPICCHEMLQKKQVMKVHWEGGDFSDIPDYLVSSWNFAKAHFARSRLSEGDLYNGTQAVLASAIIDHSLLRHALSENRRSQCMVLEFGVSFGKSLRMLAELVDQNMINGDDYTPEATTIVAGFDTFTGLPEAWGDEPVGSYSTGGLLPAVPQSVILIRGLFRNTLPSFLSKQFAKIRRDSYSIRNNSPIIALANIDCDLYGASLDVFNALDESIPEVPSGWAHEKLGRIPVIRAGSLLCFDEFFMYDGWQYDEARAFFETTGWRRRSFEYMTWSLSSKQVAVKALVP